MREESSPRPATARFRARLVEFLVRLLAGIGVGVVTYWMVGHPQFMRGWLFLTALIIVAAVIFLVMRRLLFARFLLGLAVPICVVTAIFWAAGRPQFWQSEIAAYEKADQANPPARGVIVFAGGSSIRKWKTLNDDMKPLEVINRGCGGCELAHVNYYARRIVTPYRPRAVVVYAGDNDLSDPPWKSPQTVLNEFIQFVALIHGELPDTRIFYVSMKPAPWGDWRLMDQTNRMIAVGVGPLSMQLVRIGLAHDRGRNAHAILVAVCEDDLTIDPAERRIHLHRVADFESVRVSLGAAACLRHSHDWSCQYHGEDRQRE